MPTVLVDAPNVRRSQWPNIAEHDVVELSRTWAADRDARVVVVFDGEAPGGVVGERELDGRCTLVGSGAATADDWLVRRAEECRTHGEPYWLVTSDRALRAEAGRHAERVVGGGSFARELRSLERRQPG